MLPSTGIFTYDITDKGAEPTPNRSIVRPMNRTEGSSINKLIVDGVIYEGRDYNNGLDMIGNEEDNIIKR